MALQILNPRKRKQVIACFRFFSITLKKYGRDEKAISSSPSQVEGKNR